MVLLGDVKKVEVCHFASDIMNFFEGGRRILMIIIGVSVLATILGFDGVSSFEKIKNLALWVAFLWGAAWAIGWVVRGVLGIPNGQDTKN